MPLSGPPGGDLESQFFPCGRRICAFSFHRPFLLWLSIGVNPQKPLLFAVCIFQASSFSQTPPLVVPSGTGFLGGYRCKGLNPVRGLRRPLTRFLGEVGLLLGCKGLNPVRGLRPPVWEVDLGGLEMLLGMEPRQGIATLRVGPVLLGPERRVARD